MGGEGLAMMRRALTETATAHTEGGTAYAEHGPSGS